MLEYCNDLFFLSTYEERIEATASTVKKAEERKKLQEYIQCFLDNGGKITIIPTNYKQEFSKAYNVVSRDRVHYFGDFN